MLVYIYIYGSKQAYVWKNRRCTIIYENDNTVVDNATTSTTTNEYVVVVVEYIVWKIRWTHVLLVVVHQDTVNWLW